MGVVLLLVLGASALLDLQQVRGGPVVCPLRRTTGVPCPGCGLSRSFVATAHLGFREAFAFHPFGPLLFAGCALGLLAIAFRLVAGRWPLPASAVPWIRRGLWAVAAVWMLWAVVRAARHLV